VKPLPIRRQRGAIAIMFGLTLVVLLAAGGLVIDLGHLYVLKSELQNGADSGALAGAKELDTTAAGVARAATKALAYAQQNSFNFSSALVLDSSNLAFATHPNGPWYSVGEAQANPYSMSFIRLDTGARSVPTYLMGVAGIPTIATAAVAVAGRSVVDIIPLGVCSVPPHSRYSVPEASTGELREFGFRRGTTYDLLQLGKIAGPPDAMLINPVDSPPAACDPSHSSAHFAAPFLCQGNSAISSNATHVYANTGMSAGPIEKALNSRFNDYTGGSACSPASAPPDRNVREYIHDDGSVDWMSTPQDKQEQPISSSGLPQPATSSSDQGVLWTYSRPVRTDGTPFGTDDWDDLYGPISAITANYPAGPTASPYAQSSGPHFLAPATNTPTSHRRLMNLAIIDCNLATGGAMSCRRLPVLGFGRFFLQRRAALTGPDKGLWVEFAGLIEPVPNAEIKLYR
jgi:Flp pilus assembly protein TadG